jgi:hypothetical protein
LLLINLKTSALSCSPSCFFNTIDDLNDWYQHWLHQDADLYAQYKNISNAELEQDLRNSTLLVRFAEADFGLLDRNWLN